MELSRYLEIIGRRWWMVVSAVSVTTLLTVFLVVQQPWVYGSSGTFVVRPRSVDSAEVVRAIDTLIRGVEINSTYATIARSEAIRERAKQQLGPGFDSLGLTVASDVVAGTNVLEISVRGPDPETTTAFATAVGEETVAYILELEDAFELKPLDSPEVEETPVGPNKTLTVITGVLFGAMVGVVATIVADQLASAARRRDDEEDLGWQKSITDAATGAARDDFFMMRFSEEMSRARNSGRTFAVGLLRFVVPVEQVDKDHTTFLRAAADAAVSWRRTEDVISHIGGETLAVLLPDFSVQQANVVMEAWKVTVIDRLGSDLPEDYSVTVGVASYTGSEEIPGNLAGPSRQSSTT